MNSKKNEIDNQIFDLCHLFHDLKTPLSAIMGMTTLTWSELEDKEKVKDRLSRIEIASNYLLSMVNDILDTSIIIDGRMPIKNERFTLTRIIEFLEQLHNPLFEKKLQTFEIKKINIFQEELIGDFLRLSQILTNLLSNSMKYTGSGGRIILEFSQISKDKDTVILQMKVIDNGIGMSKEFMERIFEPCSQEYSSGCTQRESTGLGLFITKNLVTLMGGEITVTSKPRTGSIFTVNIPCGIPEIKTRHFVLEKDLSKVKKLNFNTQTLKNVSIILAEDNPDMIDISTEILSRAGAEIIACKNGLEAVETFHDTKKIAHIILMDIKMPIMNGIDAIKEIRISKNPNARKIPIIALTANSNPIEKKIATEAGANEIISKPINYAELIYSINKHLNRCK